MSVVHGIHRNMCVTHKLKFVDYLKQLTGADRNGGQSMPGLPVLLSTPWRTCGVCICFRCLPCTLIGIPHYRPGGHRSSFLLFFPHIFFSTIFSSSHLQSKALHYLETAPTTINIYPLSLHFQPPTPSVCPSLVPCCSCLFSVNFLGPRINKTACSYNIPLVGVLNRSWVGHCRV